MKGIRPLDPEVGSYETILKNNRRWDLEEVEDDDDVRMSRHVPSY